MMRARLAILLPLLLVGMTAVEDTGVDEIKKLIDAGRYADAETAGRAILERVVSQHGENSLEASTVLHQLVYALLKGGKNAAPETVTLGRRALEIRRKHLLPDDLLIADSLSMLGSVLYLNADYKEARSLFEEGLQILQRSLGQNHEEIARAVNNLANLAADEGNLVGARALYEKGLAICRMTGPPDLLAIMTGNFGTVLSELLDYEGAIDVLNQALHLTEAARGTEHPEVASVLDNLAEAHRGAGDYQGARALQERALRIREKALGPEHRLVGASLTNLGNVLTRLGEYDAAQSRLERALRIREASLGPDHPVVAITLTELANVHFERGERAAARPEYERALRIRETRMPASHPLVSNSRLKMALLDQAEGNYGPALDRALQATADLRDFAVRATTALSEREALQLMSSISETMDIVLGLSVGSDVPGEEARVDAAFDALVRSRAIVLDEMARRHHDVLQSDRAEVKALAADLGAARGTLARLLMGGSRAAADPAFLASWKSAQDEVDHAARALADASMAFRAENKEGRAGLDEVAAVLPAGSALVSFVHTGGRYVAFVRRQGQSATTARDLATSARIEEAIQQWRQQISAQPDDTADLVAYTTAGVALRELIWDPLAGAMGDAALVFLVPDGALHEVSFGTLPTTDGRYLVETGPVLHYLSAERDLIRHTSRDSSGSSPGKGKLLVLGGPDFEGDPDGPTRQASARAAAESAYYRGPLVSCESFESLRFPKLPGSLAEAEEVESLWRKRGGDVLKITARDATELAFKQHATGRTVLHLATHGFWFSCEDAVSAGPASESATPPLLLSGLSLAGANRRNDPADTDRTEDGVLTADEIASLDLRGVQWVVLSACQTGGGPIQRSEGVFGLRRAFQMAGAGTLITSLWPVSDLATRDWMVELYRARLDGAKTPEALRTASRRILDARREAKAPTHPFFWGAFLAAGDWN